MSRVSRTSARSGKGGCQGEAPGQTCCDHRGRFRDGPGHGGGVRQRGGSRAVTFHTDEEGAQETRRRVEDLRRRALMQQVDVRDEASVALLFEAVQRELGPPDILVNNARMGSGGSPVAETTTEDFDTVTRTDLYGPFFCRREFIRHRKATGPGGRILNITSCLRPFPAR
ncbi:SDR family NAD(P)-dependent oxidoreductase [Microvirga makkahensis]|uniref:SDR family NAD(P)-dependent oxidoreductase n=1 Tax=Microvirga makkahensis TaxID=1128670 RepID=UPI00197B3894|nr:SDR family oxidoreductase [Microvirga makkahensis]